MKQIGLLFLLILLFQPVFSQNVKEIKWWNPEQAEFQVIEGQGWQDGLAHFYDRLPAKAESKVRKAVWNLSQDAAGLKIKFRTNAKDIYVRYLVSDGLSSNHFPATGKSGMDLYAVDENGQWNWSGSQYKFGDTIEYHFFSLPDNYEREYHLYLPLYNKVKWMEIGVTKEAKFTPLPQSSDLPIVVYGTSIAQGGVASRPGMAWTAILQRKMHRPLINLAFSGNGRLETPVARLLTELNPKVYIVDCLPNMTRFPSDTITARMIKTIKILRESKPETPILITEHADAAIPSLNGSRNAEYNRANRAGDSAFTLLKQEGMKHIYWLSAEEIGLNSESTVEGLHPTDGGMMIYANAYEKKLRAILKEPVGSLSTTQPVSQYRDRKYYWWGERHARELELLKQNPPKVVFIGNSITHYWSGKPEAPIHRGDDSWNKYFAPHEIQNLGYGWDRVENTLWRVYHGELDGYQAKRILINIGTNNIGINSDEEIVAGLKLLIQAVKDRQPLAKILMVGIYPRRDHEKRVVGLNNKILKLSADMNVDYADPGNLLLNNQGKIQESLFVDGLHPNAEGYEILGKELQAYLNDQ